MSLIDFNTYLSGKMKQTPVKVGADPEVFVTKNKKFISAVGLVPGTKEKPHPLMPDIDMGYTIQQDNVAVEFGIPPSKFKDEFVAHINAVKSAAKQNFLKEFSYSNLSAVSFPEDQLMTAEANTFGCEADYNAWTGQINPSPSVEDKTLRSAGGHIHIGGSFDKRCVIQWMDVFHGLPSVLMDKGELRKKLYGKPGACRYKSYGVEYRVPSNYWIFDNKLIGWSFDCAQVAANLARRDMYVDPMDGADVQKAILNNDKKLARELCDYFGALVLK